MSDNETEGSGRGLLVMGLGAGLLGCFLLLVAGAGIAALVLMSPASGPGKKLGTAGVSTATVAASPSSAATTTSPTVPVVAKAPPPVGPAKPAEPVPAEEDTSAAEAAASQKALDAEWQSARDAVKENDPRAAIKALEKYLALADGAPTEDRVVARKTQATAWFTLALNRMRTDASPREALAAIARAGALDAGNWSRFAQQEPFAELRAKTQEALQAIYKDLESVDAAQKKGDSAAVIAAWKAALAHADELPLDPRTERNIRLNGYRELACRLAEKKDVAGAVSHLESAVKAGADWGWLSSLVTNLPVLGVVGNDVRFAEMVARTNGLFAQRTLEEVSVDALGDSSATVTVTATSADEWALFKLRARPLAHPEQPPQVRSALHTLAVAPMPVEVASMEGAFKDKERAFVARYSLKGNAKKHGKWRYLLAGPRDWRLEGVDKGERPVARLVCREHQTFGDGWAEFRTLITLPAGAKDVELKQNFLHYALADAPVAKSKNVGRPGFRLDAKNYVTSVVYKVYADRRWTKFWAAKAVFTNESAEPVTSYKVRFKIEDYSPWSPWETCDKVAPGQTVVDAFHPILDRKVETLTTATPASLTVEYEYTQDGKTVRETDAATIKMLGRNDGVSQSVSYDNQTGTFYDRFCDEPELLGGFAFGDDPVIKKAAGLLVRSLGRSGAATMYDQDALRYMEAAYNLLRTNVAYEKTPVLQIEGDQGQYLKFGRDVLRTHSGTCITLAILYASLCDAVGLDSILTCKVYQGGHCYPGVRLPESGIIVYVESTGCGGGTWGNSMDFVTAVNTAGATNDDAEASGLIIDVDVRALRAKGMLPPELEPATDDILKDVKFPLVDLDLVGAWETTYMDQGVRVSLGLDVHPTGEFSGVFSSEKTGTMNDGGTFEAQGGRFKWATSSKSFNEEGTYLVFGDRRDNTLVGPSWFATRSRENRVQFWTKKGTQGRPFGDALVGVWRAETEQKAIVKLEITKEADYTMTAFANGRELGRESGRFMVAVNKDVGLLWAREATTAPWSSDMGIFAHDEKWTALQLRSNATTGKSLTYQRVK